MVGRETEAERLVDSDLLDDVVKTIAMIPAKGKEVATPRARRRDEVTSLTSAEIDVVMCRRVAEIKMYAKMAT